MLSSKSLKSYSALLLLGIAKPISGGRVQCDKAEEDAAGFRPPNVGTMSLRAGGLCFSILSMVFIFYE